MERLVIERFRFIDFTYWRDHIFSLPLPEYTYYTLLYIIITLNHKVSKKTQHKYQRYKTFSDPVIKSS